MTNANKIIFNIFILKKFDQNNYINKIFNKFNIGWKFIVRSILIHHSLKIETNKHTSKVTC